MWSFSTEFVEKTHPLLFVLGFGVFVRRWFVLRWWLGIRKLRSHPQRRIPVYCPACLAKCSFSNGFERVFQVSCAPDASQKATKKLETPKNEIWNFALSVRKCSETTSPCTLLKKTRKNRDMRCHVIHHYVTMGVGRCFFMPRKCLQIKSIAFV